MKSWREGNTDRTVTPKLTREQNESIEIPVNSCISSFDRIGMSMCKKSSTAKPQEVEMHGVSKIKRAFIMKIAIEDTRGRQQCWNIQEGKDSELEQGSRCHEEL